MISHRHQAAIVSALYDAELDTARSAMNANDLAQRVGPLLGIKCKPAPLWQIVREMVQNRIGVTDRPDISYVHVVGCDSTDQSLVQLTGLGIKAAREIAKNQEFDLSRSLTATEIAVTVGIGGLPVLA